VEIAVDLGIGLRSGKADRPLFVTSNPTNQSVQVNWILLSKGQYYNLSYLRLFCSLFSRPL
jgi:hypothetical protein